MKTVTEIRQNELEVLKELINDSSDLKKIDNFIFRIVELLEKKKSDKTIVNSWLYYKNADYFKDVFNRLCQIGYELDNKEVSLSSMGISYSYKIYIDQFYRMFPNGDLDYKLVYSDDIFSGISVVNGKANYTISSKDPFSNKMEKNIIGGFAIIKRENHSDYYIALNRDELMKHKKLAKQDYISNTWWEEFHKKTLIRKVMTPFSERFKHIIDEDNNNYQLKTNKEDYTENELKNELNELKDKIINSKDITEIIEIYDSIDDYFRNELINDFKNSIINMVNLVSLESDLMPLYNKINENIQPLVLDAFKSKKQALINNSKDIKNEI